jgi:hypothetical protein
MLSFTAALVLLGAISIMILLLGIIGYVKLSKMHLKFPDYEVLNAEKKFHYSNLNEKWKRKLKGLKKMRTKHTEKKIQNEQDEDDQQNLVDDSLETHETSMHVSKHKSTTQANFRESSNLYDRMLSDFMSADETNEQTKEKQLCNDEKNSIKDSQRVASFILNEKM